MKMMEPGQTLDEYAVEFWLHGGEPKETMNITQYFSGIGRKGGKAKSKAKAKAAKANGRLGGRPKKTPKAKTRPSSGSNKLIADSHAN